MTTIKAYAAMQKNSPLELLEYDPGELHPEQIEIDVAYCGICHSDLSMIKNDWEIASYPLVPGHEVVGTIAAIGEQVKNLKVGQKVGLGWFSQSCMACPQCLSGNQNLCPTAEQTIVNRHGGFANRVRCHWGWAVPLPDSLDMTKAGPLFCGGLTVFNPIVQFNVKPTDRVGVIGIGGLGHMALQFLNKWGCDVTAFTSSDSKVEEAQQMGAHHVVNSRDDIELEKIAGSLDFILSTVNAALNWPLIMNALSPKGRFHIVGVVPEPIPVIAFPLILGQKSISGSPLGSPTTTARMLEFCGRHGIAPITEMFPMSKVNDALEHLQAGKARYRIVLENDMK